MNLDETCITAMNFHYLRHPLRRFLDDVVSVGVEHVEIWGAAPHFYSQDSTLVEARKLRTDAVSRGLKIACFTPEQCVYPINLASREPRLRDRSLRYFLDCMDLCAEMESPAMLVTPGSGYANEPADEAWTRCENALGRLAGRAEQLGLDLYLEALPPAWTNVVADAYALSRMIAAIGSGRLRPMLDTAAAIASAETAQDYIDRFGDEIAHVHMIDSDSGGAHLAWGDGELSAPEIVAALKRRGFTGALSLEITNPRYYLEPLPVLQSSVATLRDALRLCGAET